MMLADRRVIAFACIAVLLLAELPATAAVTDLDPPADTLVECGVQVTFIEVGKIDAVEQAFYADFYITLYCKWMCTSCLLCLSQPVPPVSHSDWHALCSG